MNLFTKKNKKAAIVFFHIIAWILYISMPYLATDSPVRTGRISIRFFSSLTFIVYFYLNYFLFIPLLFNKQKYLFYIFVTFACLIVLVIINADISKPITNTFPRATERPINKMPINFLYFRHISVFSLFLFGSMSLRLFQSRKKREKQLKDIENEQIKSELSYLKMQVSPHFLFNSLNSVYSLAVKKSEQTPDVVLKLSDLMRYMIYTSSEKQVSLKEETEHIKNYIELQEIRLFDIVKVSFKIENPDSEYKLEPMLLIPFVENAFKYGVSYTKNCEIKFSMKAENKEIIFEAENTIFKNNKIKNDENTGIGLVNIKRRLELLYKNNHKLRITETNNKFKVYLKINILK